jgi:DNA ligase-1
MPDLEDGQRAYVKGSGAKPWEIRNVGGVYSCNCPAWRNQSRPIEQRTCKHIIAYRGEEAEQARLGAAMAAPPRRASGEKKEGPPLLLAEAWDLERDVSGWWMSEKLDGVRAYWDGKQFRSRYGNTIHAPDWFVEALPPVPLDGEMWMGRKQFQRTSGFVRRQDKHEHWRDIRYVVFDAPAQDQEFEARLQFLDELLRKHAPPYARAHEHKPCKGRDHLFAELAEVQRAGGEGLMLRQPGSHYAAGRSSTLLKVKTFHDAEARVTGYQAGRGRHKGRMGALCLELSDGTEFEVGTGFSDAARNSPPAVGSIITFKYQELSDDGKPRFPVFVRQRTDLTELPPFVPPARPAPVEEAEEEGSVSVSVPASPPPAPAEPPRRFEYAKGGAAKFWEVARQGRTVTLRFGAVGGAKQSKTETFASEAEARAAVEEMIAEKFDDGFTELVAPAGAAPAFVEEKPPEAKPAPPKKKAAPAPEAPASKPGGKRYFEFVGGTSSKFWEVWVEGAAMFTRYGRIGSGGSITRKDFPDEPAARKAADKLIAEKTGKGYVEKG